MALTNKTIADSFKDILHVSNSNNGLDGTTRNVLSGEGSTCGLHLSTNNTLIKSASNSATALQVQNASGTNLLEVNTTATTVKALGQFANTNLKEFGMSSGSSEPSGANTWTVLLSQGAGRAGTFLEMGTDPAPATTLTISNNGQHVTNQIWYVPFNITIDAVHVLFAPDTTSTNAVSFSMMSYDADLDNSTTSGNLTGGVEIVKSGSATTMASEDDVYYQTLTIVAGDVDTNASSTAGKVIMAFVAQNGTSADLSVQMQVVYHLRST